MLVSVIIPCYNVENYIADCLNSVYNQTYPLLEVICVDNNSSDSTLAHLKRLKSTLYPNLAILSEVSPGAPFARNRGIMHSHGEWIQFLDADDLLLPTKIEHQVAILKGHHISTSFIAAASYKDTKTKRELSMPESDVWKGLFITRLGNTCSNLFNKNALQKIHGWDTSLKSSQEYDLMFRLLKEQPNSILIDKTPLTIIQTREFGQISHGRPKERLTQYVDLRIKIWSYLSGHKESYFKKEKGFFQQQLFISLQLLFAYDEKRTREIFKLYLGSHFYPQTPTIKSKLYGFLYQILGFERAEKLRIILGKPTF